MSIHGVLMSISIVFAVVSTDLDNLIVFHPIGGLMTTVLGMSAKAARSPRSSSRLCGNGQRQRRRKRAGFVGRG
jgi:hypothetical protein